MIRFQPGDLVTTGLYGRVYVFDDKPGPKYSDNSLNVVGFFQNGQLGLVINLIDRDHLLITTGECVGVVLAIMIDKICP